MHNLLFSTDISLADNGGGGSAADTAADNRNNGGTVISAATVATASNMGDGSSGCSDLVQADEDSEVRIEYDIH